MSSTQRIFSDLDDSFSRAALARAFDYAAGKDCPGLSAHLKRLKDAKQTDALENDRVRLGKILETPVQAWPEPKILAWWNK